MKNKVLGRRCIAISLAAALSAGLTACGNTGGDTQAATTETTQITETAQTAERIYSLTFQCKYRPPFRARRKRTFADSKLNSEQRNKYHGNFHYEQQYQWKPASWSE